MGQPGWYPLNEQEIDKSETEIASVNLASGDLFLKTEDVAPRTSEYWHPNNYPV